MAGRGVKSAFNKKNEPGDSPRGVGYLFAASFLCCMCVMILEMPG